MKKTLLLAAIAGMGLFAANAAEAQRNKPPYDLWCRDQGLGRAGGSVPICMAYTWKQCMDSRTSQGETCYLNPRYGAQYRSY